MSSRLSNVERRAGTVPGVAVGGVGLLQPVPSSQTANPSRLHQARLRPGTDNHPGTPPTVTPRTVLAALRSTLECRTAHRRIHPLRGGALARGQG